MLTLNEALTLANGTVPHQRRGVVEQDEIDLVGAQALAASPARSS